MARRRVEEDFDRLSALLLLSHEYGHVDEEELLLLLAAARDDAHNSLLAPLQFVGQRLCLDELDEETCLRRFRISMKQGHIQELQETL